MWLCGGVNEWRSMVPSSDKHTPEARINCEYWLAHSCVGIVIDKWKTFFHFQSEDGLMFTRQEGHFLFHKPNLPRLVFQNKKWKTDTNLFLSMIFAWRIQCYNHQKDFWCYITNTNLSLNVDFQSEKLNLKYIISKNE